MLNFHAEQVYQKHLIVEGYYDFVLPDADLFYLRTEGQVSDDFLAF